MPSLADTLGAPLHRDPGDPSSTPAVYEATVSSVAGGVFVIAAGYSRTQDFGPCQVVGGNVGLGDDVYVAFTDERDPVVFATGGTQSFASILKLGVD